MLKSLRFLWLAAGTFLVTAVVCICLAPGAVFSHYGLSYYGNFQHTIGPYGLGLTLTAYFIIRFCHTLHVPEVARSFKIGLECIALGILGIVATPSFSGIAFIEELHVLFGIFIFVTQAGLSLHYLIAARTSWVDWALLYIQLAAILIALLSFKEIGVLNLMLPAQVLSIFAFNTLLIRAMYHRSKEIKFSKPSYRARISPISFLGFYASRLF